MDNSTRGPRLSRTPSLARILVVLFLGFSLAGAKGGHAETLAESDVILLAKERDPVALLAKAKVALAAVAKKDAQVRTNPFLSFNHEHFASGEPGDGEDVLMLTVPIDLSHRRASKAKLAASGVASASASAARAQSEAVAQSLQLFYRVLGAQETLKIEEAASQRLSEAAQIVKRQKEEGKVSGYDQIRIEIELEMRQSEQRETQLEISQLQSQLAGLLGVEPGALVVRGSLQLRVPAGKDQTSPSSLSFLRMARAQASEARKSASKRWLPTIRVSAGPRMGFGEDTRFGYVAGITVELPWNNKNEALQARTRAALSLANARVQAAEMIRKRSYEEAESTMKLAAAEAKRFDEATAARVERLERAAASRYREGQSIIELLDAQRTRSEVRKRQLQLRLRAKEAEVSLRAARGEFE